MKRLILIASAALLAACGDTGFGGDGVQVETAWCDEMLDSDVMARSLRGEIPGDTVAQARAQCVLIPVGTDYKLVEEAQNPFMQTFIKAEVVRPDTGEVDVLWVRKDTAGIR